MCNLKMEAGLSSGKNSYFLQNYRNSRSRRQWYRQNDRNSGPRRQ